MVMPFQHRQHHSRDVVVVSRRDWLIAISRRKVFEQRNGENRRFVFVLLSAAVKEKDKGGYGAREETRDCCTCGAIHNVSINTAIS